MGVFSSGQTGTPTAFRADERDTAYVYFFDSPRKRRKALKVVGVPALAGLIQYVPAEAGNPTSPWLTSGIDQTRGKNALEQFFAHFGIRR